MKHRIPIRVVFYKDEDDSSVIVAHCLEFDLAGDGAAHEEALAMLAEAITIQLEASVGNKNPHNLFSPASAEYQRMFFQGKDVVVGELGIHIETDGYEVERVDAWEFEGELACA